MLATQSYTKMGQVGKRTESCHILHRVVNQPERRQLLEAPEYVNRLYLVVRQLHTKLSHQQMVINLHKEILESSMHTTEICPLVRCWRPVRRLSVDILHYVAIHTLRCSKDTKPVKPFTSFNALQFNYKQGELQNIITPISTCTSKKVTLMPTGN